MEGVRYLLQEFFDFYPSLDQADKDARATAAQTGGRAAVISLLESWAASHADEAVREKAAEAVSALSG